MVSTDATVPAVAGRVRLLYNWELSRLRAASPRHTNLRFSRGTRVWPTAEATCNVYQFKPSKCYAGTKIDLAYTFVDDLAARPLSRFWRDGGTAVPTANQLSQGVYQTEWEWK